MSDRFRARALLGPAIAVVLAVAWYVCAKTATVNALKRNDTEAVDLASKLLAVRVEHLHERLGAECAVIAADTDGLKGLLATPGVQRADIVSGLNTFKDLLGLDLIVAVSARGQVIGVVGDDTIADGDFAKSALITGALQSERYARDFWGSRGRLLAMAACVMKLEDSDSVVIAIGLSVDQAMLTGIGELTQTRGAIALSETPVANTAGDLTHVLGVVPGADVLINHGGTQMLARAEAMRGTVQPVRVYWMRTLGAGRADLGFLGVLLWIPALAAAAIGVQRAAREPRT